MLWETSLLRYVFMTKHNTFGGVQNHKYDRLCIEAIRRIRVLKLRHLRPLVAGILFGIFIKLIVEKADTFDLCRDNARTQ